MPKTSKSSRSSRPSRHVSQNHHDLVDTLAKRVLPEKARKRIQMLTDEMDQLLFVDENNELAVERKAFIRFVNNKELVPANLRDIVLVETSKHLGRRLKELGRGRRIAWQQVEKHGLPTHGFSEAEIRSWGVTENTSTEELAVILQTQIPNIPAFWMNNNSAELADSLVQRFMTNRTVWDCLVSNLGWWAAITLGGGLVIFLILVGSGVPWPWALLIAGIYQSVATLYFLLQCAADPNFQQP